VHLDLAVSDLDAAEAEAIRLGARRAGEQPHPTRWRVMLDPAGHPFCLCDWSKELPANRKDPDHGPVTSRVTPSVRSRSKSVWMRSGSTSRCGETEDASVVRYSFDEASLLFLMVFREPR
jgi:hypothetical protein